MDGRVLTEAGTPSLDSLELPSPCLLIDMLSGLYFAMEMKRKWDNIWELGTQSISRDYPVHIEPDY